MATLTVAPPITGQKWRMKLSTAVQQYLEELRAGASKNTYKAYGCDLSQIVRMAAKDSVLLFNDDLVALFFTERSKAGDGMATLHRKRATVNGFAEWGVFKGLWAKNPLARNPMYRFKTPESVPKPFTPDELERLMALPLTGAQSVVRALLRYTGLRVTPLCEILIANVVLKRQTLALPDGQHVTIEGTIRSKGKGSKTLVGPIIPELAPVLAEWLQEHPGRGQDYLLRRRNGHPYRDHAIQRMCCLWGKQAGVSDCHPHRWRHTFATDLYARGVDPAALQRLMGHANIATTMVYTRVSDAQAFAAVLKARM